MTLLIFPKGQKGRRLLLCGVFLVAFTLYKQTTRQIVISEQIMIQDNESVASRNGISLEPMGTPLINNSHKHQMTIAFQGGLGNHIFMFASLLGISHMNHLTPVIPESSQILPYFKIDVKSFGGNFKLNRENVTIFGETFYGTYDERVEKIGSSCDVILSGYFQSWRYFHSERNGILNQLTFRNDVMATARVIFSKTVKRYNSNIDKNRSYIAVHVRRGDFAVRKHVALGYTIAGRDYFDKAMDHMRQKFKNVLFIVASDDLVWSKKNLGDKDVVFVERGHTAGVDLAILSLCNHTIQSSGTFSWWAAYLAGGYSTYFADFPQKGSKLDLWTNKHDYYRPDWVPL